MATVSTSVHHVVGVKVIRVQFSDFHTLELQFTLADGSTAAVCAFSAEPLTLADVPERQPHAEVRA